MPSPPFSRAFLPGTEFPEFDGVVYVRIDGYFSSDTKTKIPFESTTHEYYVEHVADPKILDPEHIRTYYRKVPMSSVQEYHAVFTSKNVVKKVKKTGTAKT